MHGSCLAFNLSFTLSLRRKVVWAWLAGSDCDIKAFACLPMRNADLLPGDLSVSWMNIDILKPLKQRMTQNNIKLPLNLSCLLWACWALYAAVLFECNPSIFAWITSVYVCLFRSVSVCLVADFVNPSKTLLYVWKMLNGISWVLSFLTTVQQPNSSQKAMEYIPVF